MITLVLLSFFLLQDTPAPPPAVDMVVVMPVVVLAAAVVVVVVMAVALSPSPQSHHPVPGDIKKESHPSFPSETSENNLKLCSFRVLSNTVLQE